MSIPNQGIAEKNYLVNVIYRAQSDNETYLKNITVKIQDKVNNLLFRVASVFFQCKPINIMSKNSLIKRTRSCPKVFINSTLLNVIKIKIQAAVVQIFKKKFLFLLNVIAVTCTLQCKCVQTVHEQECTNYNFLSALVSSLFGSQLQLITLIQYEVICIECMRLKCSPIM